MYNSIYSISLEENIFFRQVQKIYWYYIKSSSYPTVKKVSEFP